MQLLDGRKIAEEILERVKSEVAKLNFRPVFCDVLVGDDKASAQYVKMKGAAAEKVGMKFRGANYGADISTERLISEIKKISREQNMCGLIVQLPLPSLIDKQAVLDAIDPKIDADCTGKINSDLFYQGKAYVEFPTAAAVMEILDTVIGFPSNVIPSESRLTGRAEESLKFDNYQSLSDPSAHSLRSFGRDDRYKDKKFLVIGYGQLVGRPVSFLLGQRGYKVDVARSKTENILELMKQADVIISAAGKPKLVTGNKIKPGSIIIDAGTSESQGGIVGDVDFESVKNVAGFISPVPGGVGPVTVAKLLENVLKIAKQKRF